MKRRETNHYYLKDFHEELGLAADSLLDQIENNTVPQGLKHYGTSARCGNKFLRLFYSVKTDEFYIEGFDSEGKLRHIML